MEDRNQRNPAEGMHYLMGGYAPWAPRGLVGSASTAGPVSAIAGVSGLVLSATSTLPVVAWIAALLGIAFGLRLLLPRATTRQKALCWTGLATAVVAIGLLLG